MPLDIEELQVNDRPFADLPRRILNGEIFVVRNCLQGIDLFDKFERITFNEICNLFGDETAHRIREIGVEKIHTVLDPADIPRLIDAIYPIAESQCFDFLKSFVKEIIDQSNTFYFERKANVRFHLPYDIAARQKKLFESYAERRGPGKITLHSPHRDSWVCHPSNAINVWVALGSIKSGNSLVIFPEAHNKDIRRSGIYMSKEENPGTGVTFSMNPGDVLLFHADHLHSSEINSTDCTRHVISFRLTFKKPQYEFAHFQHYAHAALAGGSLDKFAEVPQNIASTFLKYRVIPSIKRRATGLVENLLGRKIERSPKSHIKVSNKSNNDAVEETPQISIQDIGVGKIKAISKSVCFARLENNEIRAFARYCPHNGADLSFGTIRDGKIMCPWHNLPIDPDTGTSPCNSVKKLKVHACELGDDLAHVLYKVDP